MHEEQVLRRDRLQRRVERGGDQKEAGRERGNAPAWRRLGAGSPPVERGGGDREREQDRFEAERGGVHAVAARPSAVRRVHRGRRRSATHVPSVISCSTIITIPDNCWSVTAEIPYAPW